MRFGSWQKKTLVIKYSAEPKSSAFLHWSKKMKDNILPRICRTCGTSFLGGPRAFYCQECRQERKKQQSKRYKERIKHGSVTTLGSIIQCESCGCNIIKCGGLQRFCHQCAKKHLKIIDNQQSLDWNKNNQVKVKKSKKLYNDKKQATGIHKNSGIPGVNWDTVKSKWIACVSVNHRQIKIVTTSNINVAKSAREEAQKAKETGLLTDDFINILKSKYRNL